MTLRAGRLPLVGGGSEARGSSAPGRVVLVAYEDGENLGVRYLASRLQADGHHTVIVNVRDRRELAQIVRRERPQVVGFSLIFQYLVPTFRDLARAVREAAPETHLTVGGHYASFEPEVLLSQIAELDSVVRFEGEDALAELTAAIAAQTSWRGISGLTYRTEGGFVSTRARQGRDDLDSLPWPDRSDVDYAASELPTASMLGSRGCPWKCSFCSIITFYEGNGTKGRRRRDPLRVVDELEHLHRERGVEVVLWQDDDFLAGGRRAIEWAHAIAAECVRRGLNRGLRWKISCRSDEVTTEAIAPLVRAGLTHIYMGVEAGDEESLRHMNKLLKPEVHLRAREALLSAGVSFDFGFMLFEPWSTVDGVRRNLAFLRDFGAGGVTSVGFGRLLPYAGTPVAERLKAEGRLIERDGEVDYAFLDPSLERLYLWVLDVLSERNYTAQGTANLMRRVLFEAALDLPRRPRDGALLSRVRAIAAVSNAVLLDAVSAALDWIAERPEASHDDPVLRGIAEHHRRNDRLLRGDLDRVLGRSLTRSGADSGAECPL